VIVLGNGTGSSRRQFATGPAAGVVVIQRGSQTWQKPPGGQYVRLPSGGETDASEVVAALSANYGMRLGDGGTIAGRRATRLAIVPKRPYNPSRVLFVDVGTGLVLRDQLFAPDGAKRSSTEFVALRYGPQSAGSFDVEGVSRPSTAGGFGPDSFVARTSAQAVVSETGRPIPVPRHVPDGYRACAYGVMTTGSGFTTPAVRYSDGLAAFTVFVRGARPGSGPGPRRRGAGPGPHRYGPRGRAGSELIGSTSVEADRQRAIVTYVSSTASYILIGDLAADELERVARTLP